MIRLPQKKNELTPSRHGVNSTVNSSAKPSVALVWDDNAVDFAELKKGEIREKTFYFTNTGDEPVIIDLCNACDCMTLDWTALPVKPGGRGKIHAKFDTTKKEVGDVVNDFINVILENKHPGTEHPYIFELNYKARIIE